ncbi:hypothetical protein K474DRAFT_651940 [Panus rudis PR-1116 ss-1]|nr:hypothetical protein K474DRAFT_651940 [Panus rudis PR-1116 ss-1]
MNDVRGNRRRNGQSSSLRPASAAGPPAGEESRRYFDVLPLSDHERGRSQTRVHNDTSVLLGGGVSSSSRPPSAASKLMTSMKRSFSYSGTQKKRSSSATPVYSTPEESLPPSPSSYNLHNARNIRPTIEQIAMGLHVSPTPHLMPHSSRSSKRHSTLDPNMSSMSNTRRPSVILHRRGSAPAPVPILPPPPARSSLKSPSGSTSSHSHSRGGGRSAPLTPSASDASLSSLPSSSTPSTPRSNRSALSAGAQFSTRLHLSMSKLFSASRRSVPTSPTIRLASDDDSSVSSALTPRKAVRFSTGVADDGGP